MEQTLGRRVREVASVVIGSMAAVPLLAWGFQWIFAANDAWASAVQAATTVVLAAATLAYVLLTRDLVKAQREHVGELRVDRERAAIAGLTRYLRTGLWPLLSSAEGKLFPATGPTDPRPRSHLADASEQAARSLLGASLELLSYLPDLDAKSKTVVIDLTLDINTVGKYAVLFVDALRGALAEAKLKAEVDSGEVIQDDAHIEWSDVRAHYYLAVRDPKAEDPPHPEWSDLVSGEGLANIRSKSSAIAGSFTAYPPAELASL